MVSRSNFSRVKSKTKLPHRAAKSVCRSWPSQRFNFVFIILQGDDGLVKIWDRRSLKESNPVPVGVFAGHVDGITFIDAREDARHIITNR